MKGEKMRARYFVYEMRGGAGVFMCSVDALSAKDAIARASTSYPAERVQRFSGALLYFPYPKRGGCAR